jgi:hypothetical protein
VEQGKPESETEVVTEEGVKAEEVTPELRDVESTAKALEDVDKNAWGANNGLSDNFYTTDVDGYAIKKPITNASSVTIDGVDFHIAKIDGDWKVVEKKSGLEISTGKTSNTKNAAIEDATMRLKQNGGAENLPTLIDRAIQGFKDRNIKAVESLLSKEQTPAQEVEQLRAEEQAELKAAIPNADQYLTDGKVDRAKITDAKELKKFDKIYDKYDKLITPLLPKKETKAEEVKLPKLNESNIETAIELLDDINDNKRKAERASSKRKVNLEQKISEAETELDKIQEEAKIVKVINDNFDKIKKDLKEQGLLNVKC